MLLLPVFGWNLGKSGSELRGTGIVTESRLQIDLVFLHIWETCFFCHGKHLQLHFHHGKSTYFNKVVPWL